jgi:NAD(P)-dependent dehydrogenase (short-subunit alcohol dehydrogenase family)
MNTERLRGRTALITGAASGIGAATARAFAREGARILLADVSTIPPFPDGTSASPSEEVVAIGLDVTSEAAWTHAVEVVQSRFGGLDILVNVAGIVAWDGVETTTREQWDRIVAVNQTGTWLAMRAMLPLLRASRHASIINTSSVLGLIGGGGAAAYHATKGAVRLLTKTAAVEYATAGVRVNSIHPGVIATPMISEILELEGDQQADIQRTPMRRAGTPEEIAAAMVFLAGDDSSFMTGAELVVDGGLTAH